MLIKAVTDEMNFYKKEVTAIKSEKDTLDNVLNAKIVDTSKHLGGELFRVEEEMRRHYSHQKAENSRL
jgi:hypothetical protein